MPWKLSPKLEVIVTGRWDEVMSCIITMTRYIWAHTTIFINCETTPALVVVLNFILSTFWYNIGLNSKCGRKCKEILCKVKKCLHSQLLESLIETTSVGIKDQWNNVLNLDGKKVLKRVWLNKIKHGRYKPCIREPSFKN